MFFFVATYTTTTFFFSFSPFSLLFVKMHQAIIVYIKKDNIIHEKYKIYIFIKKDIFLSLFSKLSLFLISKRIKMKFMIYFIIYPNMAVKQVIEK